MSALLYNPAELGFVYAERDDGPELLYCGFTSSDAGAYACAYASKYRTTVWIDAPEGAGRLTPENADFEYFMRKLLHDIK